MSQITILIIDDDHIMQDFIREALGLLGCGVVTASESQEADEIIQQLGPGAIRLVITDIHLTAYSQHQEGYAFYQRWAATYPELPFLLISGDPNSRALPAIRTGDVSFLAKPFTVHQLHDAVWALLDA